MDSTVVSPRTRCSQKTTQGAASATTYASQSARTASHNPRTKVREDDFAGTASSVSMGPDILEKRFVEMPASHGSRHSQCQHASRLHHLWHYHFRASAAVSYTHL